MSSLNQQKKKNQEIGKGKNNKNKKKFSFFNLGFELFLIIILKTYKKIDDLT